MSRMGIHDPARLRRAHARNVRFLFVTLGATAAVTAIAIWLLFLSLGR